METDLSFGEFYQRVGRMNFTWVLFELSRREKKSNQNHKQNSSSTSKCDPIDDLLSTFEH